MSDTLKILGAVGVGVYTSIGFYFYSILVSRAKGNVLLIFLLYVASIVLFIGGGIFGCCAVMGALHDTGQKPTSHDLDMRFYTMLSWIGVVLIYIIWNRRVLKERLNVKAKKLF